MFRRIARRLMSGVLREREDAFRLETLTALVNNQSQPNMNELRDIISNVPLIQMNVKAFGYDLARRLAAELPVREHTTARHVGLRSKASVQADLESDWAAHWCAQLHSPLVFHRKLWEFAYVLQALHDAGVLREGARGLGFGCGLEPLPSYLAGKGVDLVVTDLEPEAAKAKGWVDSDEYAADLDRIYRSEFVDRETFDRRVTLRRVDMNAIPADLEGFDFCWSICAFEHLGTIAHGLDFVRNSLGALKPGGIAVHTTEFNINPDGPTVDNWPTVLFQRRHMEELAQRLQAEGHEVAEFDWDMGDKPMDRFIDLPPWQHDINPTLGAMFGNSLHLKLGLDGFPCTCFGVVVRKAA
jgi:SAM-dependent methyltransferase